MTSIKNALLSLFDKGAFLVIAWEQRRLGEICTALKGNGLSKDQIADNGKYECVLYGHLYTDYDFYIKEVKYKTNAQLPNGVQSQFGDVLVPGSDTTPTGCAKAVSIDKSNVLLGGDINIFRHGNNINGDFLSLAMNHQRSSMIQMIKGTTVRHLAGSDLKELEISLPKSIEEQNKIGEIFIKLDSLITLRQRELEKLKNIKTGLLQKMFA